MSMTNEAQAALPLNQDSFTAETQGKSEALCALCASVVALLPFRQAGQACWAGNEFQRSRLLGKINN